MSKSTVAVSEAYKVTMLKAALENLQGRMFGMVNVKADNSLREWKGVKLVEIKGDNALVIEPNSASQVRTINLRTVREFRANKLEIRFA